MDGPARSQQPVTKALAQRMITDADFRKLLDHYDRPWRGFRKVRKGVLKRIRRHMASLHCSSVSEYIDILQRCPIEEEILQSHLRITISRFNRDRYLWDFLAEHTLSLPAAADGQTQNMVSRVQLRRGGIQPQDIVALAFFIVPGDSYPRH